MKNHQGEIIRSVLLQSGIPFTKICKKSGIVRATLYNLMDAPTVSYDYIVKLGMAIDHDFSQEFPELKKFLHSDENLTYKIKYLDLMEKHLAALEKLEKLEHPKKPVKKRK